MTTGDKYVACQLVFHAQESQSKRATANAGKMLSISLLNVLTHSHSGGVVIKSSTEQDLLGKNKMGKYIETDWKMS